MVEEFKFATPIEVRFRDIDGMGHVNNAVYFTYMEQARVRYFQKLGMVGSDLKDITFIVAEATCRFESPLRLAEGILVKVRTSEIRNSSFVMDYSVESTTDGRLVATGRTVQVYYDYQNRHPMPIPAEVRRKIQEFEGL